MRIEVAGAGSGKTSSMASRVLSEEIPDGRVLFCVAFTNAAVLHIESKLVQMNGSVPSGVRVSTIHSFLNTEIVQPYYHLLFGKRYDSISTIKLSGDYKAQNARIGELERCGLLHQAKIPERAKWVVDKKSNENARVKAMRGKILAVFQSYCHMIVVDEAQDIDKEMTSVLCALDRLGVPIELYGDPKQDVRGRKCFRQLIAAFPDCVTYRSDCHRCPERHLRLSNRLAPVDERQVADEKNSVGSVRLFFESDIAANTEKFIRDEDFGLVYISKKNDRFDTHGDVAGDKWFESLRYELETGIREKCGDEATDLEIKRAAYYIATKVVSLLNSGRSVKELTNICVESGTMDYEKRRYIRIATALTYMASSRSKGVSVKSIEAVKGLEDGRCLLILTTDLAPYLTGDKVDDNRTKHLLYVALTRSRDDLSILVTREVEERYSRDQLRRAVGISSDN
jgi:thymidine kinase